MKRGILLLAVSASLVLASNFSDGIRLFKAGKYREAKDYFDEAYHGDGVGAAGYFLGIYYLEGLGDTKADYAKAEKYLKQAYKNGNLRARCALAHLYMVQNKKETAKRYLKGLGRQYCERLYVVESHLHGKKKSAQHQNDHNASSQKIETKKSKKHSKRPRRKNRERK